MSMSETMLRLMPGAGFALAAREAHEGMLAACELTGTPVEVAEWMTTTTPWSRDDVRRRILAGEGKRWTERYRATHSAPTEQATPDLGTTEPKARD